jgi:hypothetical protein
MIQIKNVVEIVVLVVTAQSVVKNASSNYLG